jgi:ribosomal protein S18 acetylase RimI-like enzyme
MKFDLNTGHIFLFKEISPVDFTPLFAYLNSFSEMTKKRFGPHDFSMNGIQSFYADRNNTGYIINNEEDQQLIAYAVVRQGYVPGDYERYLSYGTLPDTYYDCTLAPSVADAWQRKGIGDLLMQFILKEVKRKQYRRIVLWGGVQSDNNRAVRFYAKYNFTRVADFFHNGCNQDMICLLPD